ncbi:type II toxin-antitoxin system RelE family toxin [Sorangium sp. So ce363]|uniref:type II toxin-antitoxin system RelE family toxin n=1 Tax=Sorangium sp. So ce363 TaxID=3133304 RepID=UPI003F5D5CD3
MSWEVEWMPSGIISLQRIHWRDGERIDAAVQRFATTGEGDVRRVPADHAGVMRLRVGRYRVLTTLDPWDGVMRVWWVHSL